MIFRWVQIGRAYAANFGNLSVTVIERGSRKVGHRWRVSDVFGNTNLGGDWHLALDGAIAEAERVAEREARALVAHVRGARRSRRNAK